MSNKSKFLLMAFSTQIFGLANADCAKTIYNYSESYWYVGTNATASTFPNCANHWGDWCEIPPRISESTPSTQVIDYAYGDQGYLPDILFMDDSDAHPQFRVRLNGDTCPQVYFPYDVPGGSVQLNHPTNGDIQIRCNSWYCQQ